MIYGSIPTYTFTYVYVYWFLFWIKHYYLHYKNPKYDPKSVYICKDMLDIGLFLFTTFINVFCTYLAYSTANKKKCKCIQIVALQ